MRRDKTVARIILLFSIANLVLAAPALVRQRRLVIDRADDGPTDELQATSWSLRLAGSVYQNEVVPAAPPSGPGSEDGTAPELKRDSPTTIPFDTVSAPALLAGSGNNRMLGLSDAPARQSYSHSAPQSEHEWPWSALDSLAVSGSSDLDFAEPDSGSRPSELTVSEGEAPLLHDDLLDSPSSQWHWQHTDSRPNTWEAGESSNSAGEPSQTVGKLSPTVEEPSHTVPDAPEAQGLHVEKHPWWHELYFHADADDDQGSHKAASWQSWGSEEGAEIADISHFHRSY